jgi:hypothetical protein
VKFGVALSQQLAPLFFARIFHRENRRSGVVEVLARDSRVRSRVPSMPARFRCRQSTLSGIVEV